jgi:rhodanese-related sulfurtransferase
MMFKRALAGLAFLLAILAATNGMNKPRATAATRRPDASTLAVQIEHEDDHVTALELAQWIRDRKQGLRVFDIRTDSEFTAYHIPSAERMPLTQLATLAPADHETLVLYSGGGAHAAQGWVLLRTNGHRSVYFLRGGLLEWMDDVMSPVLPTDSSRARVAALSRYFGGVPRVGGVPTPTTNASPAATAAAVAKARRRGC